MKRTRNNSNGNENMGTTITKNNVTMTGASTTDAVVGEKRIIMLHNEFAHVTCGMMLGTEYDRISGKPYKMCVWHRDDNGRSISGCAAENWVPANA